MGRSLSESFRHPPVYFILGVTNAIILQAGVRMSLTSRAEGASHRAHQDVTDQALGLDATTGTGLKAE